MPRPRKRTRRTRLSNSTRHTLKFIFALGSLKFLCIEHIHSRSYFISKNEGDNKVDDHKMVRTVMILIMLELSMVIMTSGWVLVMLLVTLVRKHTHGLALWLAGPTTACDTGIMVQLLCIDVVYMLLVQSLLMIWKKCRRQPTFVQWTSRYKVCLSLSFLLSNSYFLVRLRQWTLAGLLNHL